MSLVNHLAELRMRLIRSILAVALGAAGVLAFYDPVLKFLTKPYRDLCATRPDFNCDGSLFALGPLDGLSARMKIAGYGGLILALPILLWQIWRFIVPALNKKEKQYTVPFIGSAVILDTLESVAIFDFLVRHRSQSSISNNQVHQPCYFDDLGLRSGFSYPATDCFSAVSRSSDATHTDKAVAIRHRSYLFCGRCDHTKR